MLLTPYTLPFHVLMYVFHFLLFAPAFNFYDPPNPPPTPFVFLITAIIYIFNHIIEKKKHTYSHNIQSCALHGHLQPEAQCSSSSADKSKDSPVDGCSLDRTIDSISEDFLQYLWSSPDFTSVGTKFVFMQRHLTYQKN